MKFDKSFDTEYAVKHQRETSLHEKIVLKIVQKSFNNSNETQRKTQFWKDIFFNHSENLKEHRFFFVVVLFCHKQREKFNSEKEFFSGRTH